MQQLECAKCGAHIRRLNKTTKFSSRSFPIFLITRYDDADGDPTQVNLCRKCSDDFDEWLSDKFNDNQDIYST
jgi:hypothetical protein